MLPPLVWILYEIFTWDVIYRDGRYRVTANILRKYLGDLLITSYMNIIQESGYAEEYVKEIEVTIINAIIISCTVISFYYFHYIIHSWIQRAVLVKSLDCFWRDHLVNMNRLNSAVWYIIRPFEYFSSSITYFWL